MSIHPYIGARYVPRFLGTYDATQQYEALDVVDNGAGTSYISRIPTPPGTPLTDTDHWALYGSSSAAIASLTTRINALETDKQDKIAYDIHSFTGDTIEEKLHDALDYAKANGYYIVINCNEEVEITQSYDLYDVNAIYEDSFATVTIKGAKIRLSGTEMFTSSGPNTSLAFCPTFVGCEFYAASPAYLYDGSVFVDYINPAFYDSIFRGVGLVNNSAVDNAIFVQSPRLVGCKCYRINTEFLKTCAVWDGLFVNSQVEGSSAPFLHVIRTINKFVIKNCTIEAFHSGSPIILERGLLNVIIEDNYFEKNRPHTIEIGQDYIYKVRIEGNSFYVASNELPIDITGNAGNENIQISNNELITEDAADYLCNIEPRSSKKFGINQNRKRVSGILNPYVYNGINTVGIENGYYSASDWSYDSNSNSYKATVDYYGSFGTRPPMLIGAIKGLSRAASSTHYSMNCIFVCTVVGYGSGGSNVYDVKIGYLVNSAGNQSSTVDNAVTVTGSFAVDPNDSSHFILELEATCTSGTYAATNLAGRICDIMKIGMFNMIHE